jgi:hypothetical protein
MLLHLFVNDFFSNGIDSLKTMNLFSYYPLPSEVLLAKKMELLTEFVFFLCFIQNILFTSDRENNGIRTRENKQELFLTQAKY